MQRLLDAMKGMNERNERLFAQFNDSEFVATIRQLFEKLPETALTYVTKILSIGYAGIFAVWWITREVLSPTQNLIVGLSMILSVVTFIGNEVLNVSMFNRIANAGAANAVPVMRDADALKKFAESLVPILQSQLKYKVIRTWALRISLLLAGIGSSVIVYAIVVGLIEQYVDP